MAAVDQEVVLVAAPLHHVIDVRAAKLDRWQRDRAQPIGGRDIALARGRAVPFGKIEGRGSS
jgi:hypothetical protein